jgi:flagellar basal body-associated protein FliL
MEETNQTKKTSNKTLIIIGVLIIIVGGCYVFSQLGKSNSIENNSGNKPPDMS